MWGKFAVTFMVHVVGLILLLIPNQYQGSVVTNLLGVQLRKLDLAGLILIVLGSAFLNIYLLVSIRKQIKQINQIKQISPQDGAEK